MGNREKFKKSLIEKRKHKEELIESIKKNNVEVSSELSNYDNHPAEQGSELFEIEHNNSLKYSFKKDVKDIDEALKKVETNKYGTCEECGKKISKERLKILPQSKLCINCANESSNNNKMFNKNQKLSRPSEEQVLDAPFGRKHLNEQEDDEFEGIEQLNDTLKYGSSDTPQDMGGYKDYKEFYTNKKDSQGDVEKTDNISNKYYKSQLE
jgi:RNA polymerase-binding transcription factor DksA